MTERTTPNKGSVSGKVGSQAYLKVVHSFREQVSPLRNYLNALLKLIPSYREPGKRQSLLDHVTDGILNNGNKHLKLHRSLFIQGVKVLGGDSLLCFDGFTLDTDGYPKHYGDLFRLLASFSGDPTKVVNQDKNVSMIRLVLCILRWPYSIKLSISDKDDKEIKQSFIKDITVNDPDILYKSSLFGERVADNIRSFVDPTLANRPLTFLSNSRTYKSSPLLKENRGRIPQCLGYVDGVFNSFHYSGPVGKVTVLSEKAGKTRVITGYDGSINMTDFYSRARSVLDRIDEDTSSNQTAGHCVLQRLTARASANRPELTDAQRLERGGDEVFVSADLKAFTDNLYLTGLVPLLDLLNCRDFGAVIQSPIMVDDQVVTPSRALMGLRGTFELASIAHHGIVMESLRRVGKTTASCPYVMCGDDLFIRCKSDFLPMYEMLCGWMGLKLNLSKTVVSGSTGVFCGKVFHYGVDVSPVVPPLFSMYGDFHSFISAAGNFYQKACDVSKGIASAAKALILSYGKFYPSRFIPYSLPHKLGGIGLRNAYGLLKLLKRKMFNLCARVPVYDPLERETRSVCYPAEKPDNYVQVRSFTPNLVYSGATRPIKGKTITRKMIPNLKDLLTILEYYYSIGVYAPRT